jgi:Putative esterase
MKINAVGRTVFLLLCTVVPTAAWPRAQDTKFQISFSPAARSTPVTGRLLVVLSRNNAQEPRFQAGDWDNVLVPIFGIDVDRLSPGASAVIDATTPGFPVRSLRQLPIGDYYVQAILNVYTECHRSDRHSVWVHLDQWEGQQFNKSPGNLISEVQRVHVDPDAGYDIHLTMNRAIAPVQLPSDTEWVKHIKLKSALLSAFWGCPIYLGATVLLPKGYDTHPDAHYPVVYLQGHFSLEAPFGFDPTAKPISRPPDDATKHLNVIEPRRPLELVNEALVRNETPYEFSNAWTSENFPRMIAVTFQHPTPYYDDSYAVNSANVGPYGDAIIQELLPAVEERFRIIREPYARVVTGGSTGGWEALALQVQHPDFFGGVWAFYPDPIDFRRTGLVNIYEDENYYEVPGEWVQPQRYFFRSAEGQPQLTTRQVTELESVLGSKLRSAEQFAIWQAVYGPVGEDGYPKPLYDAATGEINKSVARYMREQGYDLRYYLETNWSKIGPSLVGKIHIISGDMDNFYLNLPVYKMEDFLANTHDPYYGGSFQYGRPLKGHGWQPTTNFELIENMAKQIERGTPAAQDTSWHYK